MNILISFVVFFSAFVTHIVIWKIRLPLNEIRMLVILFLLYPLFPFLFYHLICPKHYLEFEPSLIIIFHTLASICYFITYTGIQEKSPSLVIFRAVQKKGSLGLTYRDLMKNLMEESFIERRINFLLKEEYIFIKDRNLRLTNKGKRIVSLSNFILKIFSLLKVA
jgi:hypothetical protein